MNESKYKSDIQKIKSEYESNDDKWYQIILFVLVENHSRYTLKKESNDKGNIATREFPEWKVSDVPKKEEKLFVFDNDFKNYNKYELKGSISWQIMKENRKPFNNGKIGKRLVLTYEIPFV